MAEKTALELKREIRKYKSELKLLVTSAGLFLRGLDEVMKQPESNKRGEAIARLSNALEYARDHARYFGLGVDYRHDPETKDCPRPAEAV